MRRHSNSVPASGRPSEACRWKAVEHSQAGGSWGSRCISVKACYAVLPAEFAAFARPWDEP